MGNTHSYVVPVHPPSAISVGTRSPVREPGRPAAATREWLASGYNGDFLEKIPDSIEVSVISERPFEG